MKRPEDFIQEALTQSPGLKYAPLVDACVKATNCHPATARRVLRLLRNDGNVVVEGESRIGLEYHWRDEPVDTDARVVKVVPAAEWPRARRRPALDPMAWVASQLRRAPR